jgi:TrmH family RNA methyltransferase
MLPESVKRRITITSRQNPLVARYRAIGRGDVEALLLLDGPHLVADALSAGVPLRQAAVAAGALADAEIRALVARLTDADVEVVTAAAPVMALLSPVRSSSGIVAIADRPSYGDARLYAGGAPLVVIASDVQDPGNVGAIVRVAEAGAATGVVAAGACADPFGWKALRGSMGSSLRLPVASREHADQAVAQARRHGCRIVATTARGGRSLFDVNLKIPVAVLIGGEGAGLAPALVEAADERLTIPMQAPVESLNAAVAAALVVFEARRQRTAGRS